jgi:hypothetical protein
MYLLVSIRFDFHIRSVGRSLHTLKIESLETK